MSVIASHSPASSAEITNEWMCGTCPPSDAIVECTRIAVWDTTHVL